MLNFIFSCVYGISKNKNGKDISDYDKYKPWNAEEFSGKMKYTLDDSEEFEIFRDFNKKNPKIYNKNLEDISNNFNIDKTKGNQFFVEQTGIDETLFLNTMTICQSETVLDSSKQNVLIQKLTNVVSSGDDNTSYKKTIDKLNKKLLEEVGTTRTTERPINIVEDEIKEIELEKNNLELCKANMKSIEDEEARAKEDLETIKIKLDVLKEIKEYKQTEILEEQRIGINTNKLNEYNNKLSELKKNQANEEITYKKSLNPVVLLIICILVVGASVILKNKIISLVLGIILGLVFLIDCYKYSNFKKKTNMQKESSIKYNKEIEIIKENISQCESEIAQDREKIEQKQSEKKQYIINKYRRNTNIDEYILEEIKELEEDIEQSQREYNEIILKENTINIEKNNLAVKLESLVNKEERLEYLYEQKSNLVELSNAISLAQQGLEDAYKIMKNTITPKFTNKLTNIIKNITNEKYKNVNFNDENGLTVELENGEYINCSRLSIGTIDQMYLALRLSVLDEVCSETMPIILDEAFVYYDKERLENILKYIAKEYLDRQIIILTCTNREVEALNNINIQYNLINL